jgi:hypothetical protein
MMAEKQYNVAIEEYTRLSKERQDHSFWMANIIDSSLGLTDDIAWQNFYSHLTNDSHIFKNSLDKTLGQCIDEGLIFPESLTKFKIKEVQNGDVTHVRLTPNVCCIDKTSNGRKSVDIISQGVQEEKSGT